MIEIEDKTNSEYRPCLGLAWFDIDLPAGTRIASWRVPFVKRDESSVLAVVLIDDQYNVIGTPHYFSGGAWVGDLGDDPDFVLQEGRKYCVFIQGGHGDLVGQITVSVEDTCPPN